MSNATILVKAIKNAIASGWTIPFEETILDIKVSTADVDGTYQTAPYIQFTLDGNHDWCVGIPHIIYDHDFAKALWGDKFINPEMRDDTGSKIIAIKRTSWKFHLQQMVIADDPIEYLGSTLA